MRQTLKRAALAVALIAAALPARAQSSSDTPALNTAVTSLVGSTPIAVLPALATRHTWSLTNLSATAGSAGYAYCTDDGSTPSATHATIIVYGQGSVTDVPGAPISSRVIQCIGGGAADVNVTGEQW